jgi:hypothetical protein
MERLGKVLVDNRDLNALAGYPPLLYARMPRSRIFAVFQYSAASASSPGKTVSRLKSVGYDVRGRVLSYVSAIVPSAERKARGRR